jgi:hypothetical protein
MNALKSLSRALMTFAMVAGLMLGVSLMSESATAAGTSARITLHVFECGATSGNLYNECHNFKSNGLDGAAFRVAGVTRYTSGGYVTWGPGAGFHTVRGFNLSWGYYDSYVYCSNQVTGAVLYDGLSGGDDAVSFTTTARQEVICDWYYLF